MTVNHDGVATEQSEEVLLSIQAQHGEPKKERLHIVWSFFFYLLPVPDCLNLLHEVNCEIVRFQEGKWNTKPDWQNRIMQKTTFSAGPKR